MTWEQAEDAGLVCIPAAGARLNGSNVFAVGGNGYYWSSSACDGSKAYGVNFGDNYVDPFANGNRSLGSSVRLITESK